MCGVNAMKLAYDVISLSAQEEAKKPCIIFIHGMIESRKTWKIVAPQIAKKTGRKVFTVDVRNHGESPWSKELNFDVMADDVDEFMADHSIYIATLVGHSLGGRIAMTLALKKPEKVEKLIIEDSVPRNFRASPNGVIAVALKFAKEAIKVISEEDNEQAVRCAAREYVHSMISPESMNDKSISKYHLNMVPLKKCGNNYEWECDIDGLLDMVSTKKIEQDLSAYGVYMGQTLFLYGTKTFFKTVLIPERKMT